MQGLESVVERVNLRLAEFETLRDGNADLVLLDELAKVGIDQIELGEAYPTVDGWVWTACHLVQYGSGRLALIGG
ncbi:hypothetical protein LCGC14_0344400 [marine sediment metagenome]|uniref:Uncharacterized protein n=1 Tax=marine sediment metagenome TaxID=412755 RepID=A0A0F9TIA3_9ZZZZ